jgi:hypothetical protein
MGNMIFNGEIKGLEALLICGVSHGLLQSVI